MKKLTDDQLDRVRDHLAAKERWFCTTAESVGKELGLKNHIVKQAFQRLNLEGSMTTAQNHRGHDCTAPTRYYRRTKE